MQLAIISGLFYIFYMVVFWVVINKISKVKSEIEPLDCNKFYYSKCLYYFSFAYVMLWGVAALLLVFLTEEFYDGIENVSLVHGIPIIFLAFVSLLLSAGVLNMYKSCFHIDPEYIEYYLETDSQAKHTVKININQLECVMRTRKHYIFRLVDGSEYKLRIILLKVLEGSQILKKQLDELVKVKSECLD